MLGKQDTAAADSDKRLARPEAENAEMKADNTRYKKASRELGAKKNGIKITTASDPKESGRGGRRPPSTKGPKGFTGWR